MLFELLTSAKLVQMYCLQ